MGSDTTIKRQENNRLKDKRTRLCRRCGRGYTLLELLTVMFLVSLLLALLTPVFALARGKARQNGCLSNLRQLGIAIALYAHDYDDLYPYGADPTDKFSRVWNVDPNQDALLRSMPLLQDVLHPYAKNRELWHCYSDTGYQVVEGVLGDDGSPIRINAQPSSFEAFGSSYLYNTELAFRRKIFQTGAYERQPPYKEHSCAELVILNDASGKWHGSGPVSEDFAYNALLGDGHVTRHNLRQHIRAWSWSLERGPQ